MKKVLIVLLVLALAGGGIAYYMWNKPHETVEDRKALAVDAPALAAAFAANEQQANKDYVSQVLDVTGEVSEVSTNQDGKTVIMLKSDDPLSGVQCTMRADNNIQVKAGEKITVKGFCNAYTVVVVLSDCIIKK